MKYFMCVLASLLLLSVTACTPKETIIVKTEYEYIGVPKTLTTKIIPEAPPSQEDYVQKKNDDPIEVLSNRNVLLSKYVASLLKTTKQLNDRLDSISNFDDKNRTTVKDFNTQETERVNNLIKNKTK